MPASSGAHAPLSVAPVEGRRDLDAFIALPKRLYSGQPGYVPHLDLERRESLTEKNPFFGHATVRFWLARRGGRVVGRISAQVDRAYLERYGDATGHFGCLDVEDDGEAYAALLAAAEAWLESQGMRRATGPFSLSINEEVGLMIEGFQARSVLLVPWHPPYAGPRVEACGYAKLKDVLSYDYDVQRSPATTGRKLIERAKVAERVKVRTADMKHFDREVRILLDIFNDAWSDNWGYVPFTEAEIEAAAKALKPVVIPECAVFAEMDGEPVAFILGLANLNEAIRDLDGRLLPFGWAKLLWRLKARLPDSGRVPLMGVKKRFRKHPLLGAGLALMALDEMRANGRKLGVKTAELGWILEDNKPTIAMIKAAGGVHYKTHRIYEKALG
jgi:hypothetical protein